MSKANIMSNTDVHGEHGVLPEGYVGTVLNGSLLCNGEHTASVE
jgi:hypothetical protein